MSGRELVYGKGGCQNVGAQLRIHGSFFRAKSVFMFVSNPPVRFSESRQGGVRMMVAVFNLFSNPLGHCWVYRRRWC